MLELFEEKNWPGLILIAISIGMVFVINSYNQDILIRNAILHQSCNLPENVCPFKTVIPTETIFAALADVGIFIIGVYLILRGKKHESMALHKTAEIKKASKSLEGETKKVYDLIVGANGFIFQNELIEKAGLSKVKVTRILDKLEGRGLVERRRRGMSNVVVLKHGTQ